MKFANKIFYAIVLTTVLTSFIVLSIVYTVVKKGIYNDFNTHYRSLGQNITNSFQEMETLSDVITKNAAFTLREIIKTGYIPSNHKLAELAKKLGIHSFYVTNSQGKFIRASDISLKLENHSIFTFCPDYKNLIFGNLDYADTPILPSWRTGVVGKYIMIPSADRKYIIESEVRL